MTIGMRIYEDCHRTRGCRKKDVFVVAPEDIEEYRSEPDSVLGNGLRQGRSRIATTSPTRGLDSPLTTAPQPGRSGRARPMRRRSDGSGHSRSLASSAGKSSNRSAGEPPKDRNQTNHVIRSWQYRQNAVRWFAVVVSSGG